MSYLTEILRRAETDRKGAAEELGRALMHGDPTRLQAGYTAESAAITVARLIPLNTREDDMRLLDSLRNYADENVNNPNYYMAPRMPDANRNNVLLAMHEAARGGDSMMVSP